MSSFDLVSPEFLFPGRGDCCRGRVFAFDWQLLIRHRQADCPRLSVWSGQLIVTHSDGKVTSLPPHRLHHLFISAPMTVRLTVVKRNCIVRWLFYRGGDTGSRSLMDFSLLPEEVLVNVLRQTSPSTVVAAKRLNRKLFRIVERNHLAKPRVDDFNVEMRTFVARTRPLGKLQLKNAGTVHRRLVVTMKRKNKSRQVVEEGIEGPSSSSGTQLISEEMKKVIAAMPQLETLRVQPRSNAYLRELTNVTVRNWGSSPPTTIALYNCTTNITLHGIFDMVKAMNSDTVVDWDFGRVLPSEGVDGQLFSMMSISGLTILISDDFRSRRVQIAHGQSRIAFNLIKEEAFTT
ncbi:unnamed protein product [Nippostrongylus brasiliensis]|uniref:F-box domain-containing protein n=2 Tax=Nippostrongylus brasiliensis TaxID=27835 RepID=A0A0N4XE81_NIPBR|nr:unnamed protein product [Nippostrongylus brasiliensis]